MRIIYPLFIKFMIKIGNKPQPVASKYSPIIMTPFSIFTFGKYKGIEFNKVLRNDASYIKWLLEEASNVEITNFVFNYIVDEMRKTNWLNWKSNKQIR